MFDRMGGIEPGLYRIEFLNGNQRMVRVERCIVNANAIPLFLVSETNVHYNWMTIVSIKKDE